MPLNYSNNTAIYNKRLNNIVPKDFTAFINNPNIVIKASDKNLGLTVLDLSWYQQEGLRQLSDKKFYYPIPSSYFDDPSNLDHIQSLGKILISQLCLLYHTPISSPQITKYLTDSLSKNKTIPQFHLIPKIHKTPILGRPIVPSHSWLTTGMSVYLDYLFQKALPHLEYIIKDTKSLIRTLESPTLPDNISSLWVVTGDVSSMYTNLPINTLAFDSIINQLKDFIELTDDHRLLLRKCLHFVMHNNYFSFGDSFYRQISGIAMGTPCAPGYANMLMHYTEKVFFESGSSTQPLFYGRYIDDIFFIFQGTKTDLESFIHDYDTKRIYHDKLKINWPYSQESIEFLDLVITLKPRKIHLHTHQKKLNKYLYIPFSSYHPKENKTGFIKAELIRYIRNSSTYKEFCIIARKFFTRLRARGYPPRYLLWVFDQVSYFNRTKYLEDSPTDYNPNTVPFITTYNPLWEAPHLKKGLRIFRTTNPTYRPIISYRRNKNIGDLINISNVKKLKRFRKRSSFTSETDHRRVRPKN